MMPTVMASTHPKIVQPILTNNVDDADCDEVITSEDCDDTDATVVNSDCECR